LFSQFLYSFPEKFLFIHLLPLGIIVYIKDDIKYPFKISINIEIDILICYTDIKNRYFFTIR